MILVGDTIRGFCGGGLYGDDVRVEVVAADYVVVRKGDSPWMIEGDPAELWPFCLRNQDRQKQEWE